MCEWDSLEINKLNNIYIVIQNFREAETKLHYFTYVLTVNVI
jgi:hypothetical protein